MDKELWIKIRRDIDIDVKRSIMVRCAEQCDAIVVSPEEVHLAKDAGLKKIVSIEGGDIRLVELNHTWNTSLTTASKTKGLWAAKMEVKNREEELIALEAARKGASYLVVECPDWKVIPLENLVAEIHEGKVKLIASVDSLSEAEVALETLEIGVDGILIEVSNPKDVMMVAEIVKPGSINIPLVESIVKVVKPLGKGARVCVDTCDIMNTGEGCLVGSKSSGLFLVEAEVHDNPHVEQRPFRVNAGPVSSYILTPGGRTKYLSELRAGDRVLTVDRLGYAKPSIVGRVKIELRPLLIVEAEHGGLRYKVILQNAETIRLVTSEGSKSVSEIKPDDKILVHIEEGGRHFGIPVAGEMIVEV